MLDSQKKKGRRVPGPAIVGMAFAALAIVLTLLGLWRAHNLSLRNVLLAIVLCGGVWGVISWAIASTVAQVEEDTATRSDRDG
jgi:NAD/NADP transhydrogenase beta subunit